jgi:arylesterase/paraoxonase
MAGNNGIARASNGTFYVGSWTTGQLTILEQQTDNTLVIADVIQTGIMLELIEHTRDPSVASPSSALRFSINTGPNAFYSEKYRVDKVRSTFASLPQKC